MDNSLLVLNFSHTALDTSLQGHHVCYLGFYTILFIILESHFSFTQATWLYYLNVEGFVAVMVQL